MFLNPEEVDSILFLSLSCIGDAVMTTSVLEALHAKYPKAGIDIVTDALPQILFQHCPYRGEIILKDKRKFLRGSWEVLLRARQTKYDLVVDLRTELFAYFCKTKARLTKLNRHSYGPHAIENLMGVIRKIHGDQPIPAPNVWLSETDHKDAQTLLSSLPAGKWLAFAPGNANPKKVWPSAHYAALANALKGSFTGIILDGSPKERNNTRAVADKLQLPFVDIAGKTNLLQAAAVLKQASLFVGSDSGPGHIAAAVGTPTLTFFSVDTPERVLPWGGFAHTLQSPDEQTHSISVQQALTAVQEMMRCRKTNHL